MTIASALCESNSVSSIDLADASAARRDRVDLRLKKLLPPANSAPRRDGHVCRRD